MGYGSWSQADHHVRGLHAKTAHKISAGIGMLSHTGRGTFLQIPFATYVALLRERIAIAKRSCDTSCASV
jgi:hypothetical protein